MSFPLGEALFYGQLSLNRESIMLRTLLLTSLIFASTVYANPFGDAEKGKVKAPSCVYCHGTNGLSSNDAYPNLAGQSPKYLYDSMKAYQDGLRTGPLAEMMKAQLRMLNDEDLRDVAAFFSEQSGD
ncbi:cytochrome c [Vibrio parahaemolyticus]|nr:cytochrome C554 [Vibrio parahaemolyticus]EGQ8166642.1 cytochrome c [Vibrio parahaemolyticus]EGQ8606901.1 c-type cytochrome [Vibrio parahaemolyticus]EGQ8739333.1 c-type cytochrome [Vibrio parahaemolyticus]EGQ8903725.1 c-type cytochrome [Vibrio parahaemolyticus]